MLMQPKQKEHQYTPRAKQCLEEAERNCKLVGRTSITPPDILSAIICSNHPLIHFLFGIAGKTQHTPEFVANEFTRKLYSNKDRLQPVGGAVCDQNVNEIFYTHAPIFAAELGHPYIGIEHILFACLKCSKECADMLTEIDLSPKQLSDTLDRIIKKDQNKVNLKAVHAVNHPFLDNFTTHLNTAVEESDFKYFGRDDIIYQMMRILCRKVKSNILLVGEAGVGKTACVEALAQKMNNHQDHQGEHAIIPCDIYALNLQKVVAGAKVMGAIEERVQGVMRELKDSKEKKVLFIDEIHSINGIGSNGGASDIGNMLKPDLAKGTISCIGATTPSEYKQYIERDGALRRRFEIIFVDEPSEKETLEIIRHCKDPYEVYHSVFFTDPAIIEIVRLSNIYMPLRKFPDKAFDFLDEIGSLFKLKSIIRPEELTVIEDQIKTLLNEDAIKNAGECEILLAEYRNRSEEWTESMTSTVTTIDKTDVIAFFQKKYPDSLVDYTSVVSCQEFLDDSLKKDLVGQDEAITKLIATLSVSLSGLRNRNKPKSSVLLVGNSGVGKTQMAKSLAKIIFNREAALIHVDMSQYEDKTSVNKLIGSSAGYIGYDRGGVLTEKIKHNPHSILLIDEVDKAHPDVINMFLSILDEGFIEDNMGYKIDFSNCYIIFTTSLVETKKAEVGFGGHIASSEISLDSNRFPNEFLSRMQRVISLRDLDVEDMKEIIKRKLFGVVDVSDEVIDYLASKVDLSLGARDCESVIEKNILLPLIESDDFSEKKSGLSAEFLDNSIRFTDNNNKTYE